MTIGNGAWINLKVISFDGLEGLRQFSIFQDPIILDTNVISISPHIPVSCS